MRSPRPSVRGKAGPAPEQPPEKSRLVAGLQPVRELVRVRGPTVERVAIDRRASPRLDALARFARDQGVARVDRVDRKELDQASGGVSHQGAVAWARPLGLLEPDSLLSRPELLGVVLDGIEDPQNFGAVLRSAVAFGGAPVFWGEHSSAPLSPATFRASAGAVEHAVLCRVGSIRGLIGAALAGGIQVVGLDPRAERPLAAIDLRRPTLLVVGGEHSGLGRGVRAACSELARLGPESALDSLNASVATGIALYEAMIQRDLPRT
jgi:23S rRNA (guanosine2251-2'-O)-methyltransferase